MSVTPAPNTPQPCKRILRTADIEEQSALLVGWNQSYSQLAPGAFAGHLEEAVLPGAYLFRETTSHALLQSGGLGEDVVAVGVPRRMAGAAQFCGEACDGSQIHLFSGAEGFEFHTPAALDIAGVVLSRERLLAPCSAQDAQTLSTRIGRAGLHGAPAELHLRLGATLRDALDLLESGATAGHADALLGEIAELIRESLLADRTAETDAHRHVSRQSAGTVIAKLRAAVEASGSEDATDIDTLCRAVGVSRRTLQYVFQRELGMRPLAYVRALRLNEARRRIRQGASVTDAATAAGFWHFGRFSHDYRALFGELPKVTRDRSSQENGRGRAA